MINKKLMEAKKKDMIKIMARHDFDTITKSVQIRECTTHDITKNTVLLDDNECSLGEHDFEEISDIGELTYKNSYSYQIQENFIFKLLKKYDAVLEQNYVLQSEKQDLISKLGQKDEQLQKLVV